MQSKTFKAKIRLSNGAIQEVTVQADSLYNAKAMLEAQYGKGSIYGSLQEVYSKTTR